MTDQVRIVLYDPKNVGGFRIGKGRAHLNCFEKHPIQNLNLMKGAS